MYYWLAGVYTLTQSILSTERLIGLASVYSIISHVINLICCSFRNLWRRTEDLKRCIDTTQGGPCLLVCKVLFTESVTVSDQLNLMKSKVAFTLANWDWIWTETGLVSDLVPVAFTLDWFSYGLWVKCDVSNQHFGKKRHNSKQLSHHSNQPISRLLNPLRLGGFESSPNSVQIRSACMRSHWWTRYPNQVQIQSRVRLYERSHLKYRHRLCLRQTNPLSMDIPRVRHSCQMHGECSFVSRLLQCMPQRNKNNNFKINRTIT